MMPSTRSNIFQSYLYKLSTAAGFGLVLAITGCQSSAESNASTPNQSTGNPSVPIVSDMSQQNFALYKQQLCF